MYVGNMLYCLKTLTILYMKKLAGLLIFVLTFVSLGSFRIPEAHADSPWEITADPTLTTDIGVATVLTDIVITGDPGTVPVKLLVANGSLAMTTVTGLTFDGAQTGAELYFSGSLANVNAALATLTYTRGGAGTDTLEISLVEPGEVFFEGNDHLYEYIVGVTTWQQANTAAGLLERYGATGYLTTITSQEENDFVAERLLGAGWMGASDVGVEDVWKWVAGPESGTTFWNGDQSGSVVPGQYENWNGSEPNDSGNNEDCGQFLSGGSGFWNDLPCTVTTLPGYVVEFGAPGDLPATTGTSVAITTVAPPTVVTLSPADNAEDILPGTSLVMTFSAAVDAETGNIRIYRDDAQLVNTIAVGSGSVTGSGSTTITINPGSLARGRSYYVQVDATAFDTAAGGSYAGISNATTWNFEMAPALTSAVPEVRNVSFEAGQVDLTCEAQQASAQVTVRADGAVAYMVSEDSRFIGQDWQRMNSNTVTHPWTFDLGSDSTELYLVLKDRHGFLVHRDLTVEHSVDACEETDVIEEEEEQDVDEEVNEEENTEDASENDGAVTTIPDGTLIKSADFDTVYLVQGGKRMPFARHVIYFSWYENFDGVQLVSNQTLASIPVGKPVLPKQGFMVKIQSLPEVYVVTEVNGQYFLDHIPNEAAAAEAFGEDWAFKIIELESSMFTYFAGKM